MTSYLPTWPLELNGLLLFGALMLIGVIVGGIGLAKALEASDLLMVLAMGAIAILETIGPLATEFALKRSGEVNPDADLFH